MTHLSSNPHYPLVLTVLQHVSIERLQKAVTLLAEGSVTVNADPADGGRNTGAGEEWRWERIRSDPHGDGSLL